MNLVQIQERLKDAPIQSIMQYANGQNPMVPPYLALAELKRRESISQSAQSQQAMQQGQPRSVKEQIEQTAGLAALQQRMQQQGMQGLMAQARPQGIPEGTPQPSRQPESEGLAGVPVSKDMFNFSDGGIVAFAKGGDEGLKTINQMRDEYTQARESGDFQEASRIFRAIKEREAAAPRTVTTPVAEMDMPAPVAQRTPAAPAEQPPGLPIAERRTGQLPPPGPSAGGIGLPGTRMGAAPQTAPDMEMPATGRGGLPAIAGSGEAEKMMLETMRSNTTLEDQYAEQQKAKGLFGLQQPYGEERMKRAQAMEAARQQELEGRGMERLMRVMGGIGARGLQGASPAYLQSIEGERAADAAFRKQMDELMGGVEAQRRAEAVSGMTDAQKAVAERKKLGLGAAEKVYDADARLKLQLLQQKAAMGRLSSEEQYIMSELQKGKSYLEIITKLNEAKTGTRQEMQDSKLREAAVKMAAEEWASPLRKNPKNLSEEDWIEQKAQMLYATQKKLSGIGATTAGGAATGAGSANPIRSKADAILAGGK